MSDNLTKTEIITILIILALIVMFMLSGCTVLWTDDAFYCSMMKDIDFDAVRKEPNSLVIEKYKAQTDDVQAITPYGIIETND